MKAYINRDGCIACGLCASTCPEVFSMSKDGPAMAIDSAIPDEVQESAVECQENCPVSVITVED